MYRSNPLGFAVGALCLLGVAVAWYWLHRFSLSSKITVSELYCVVASLTGFWIGRHGQRCARIVEDIPPSKIVSAAQGYVELRGRVRALEDLPLVSGPSGIACLWYRCEIAGRGSANVSSRDLISTLFASVIYLPERYEECDSSFVIDDGTGQAVIFPHGAEVTGTHRQTWYEGDMRFTEERVMPGDLLYILGDFSTYSAGEDYFDLSNEVSAQISVWQADKPALLQRFDRNGNHVLDADEWEAMHAEALRMAKEKEAQHRAAPTVNRIVAPEGDFQYLISSRDPVALAGYYRFWRSAGLVLFLGAGVIGVWLLRLSLLR